MRSEALIDAANGLIPCDTNFSNCALVDLFSGTIHFGATVSVFAGRIAGVNDGLEAAETVDCGGRYLAPSLIDAHVHIESSLLSPSEYARVVCSRGTGAIVADPHEIANVLGYDGLRYMLDASEDLPIDVYFTMPSCVPATDFDTAGAALHASDMVSFLREERVLGLGEVMNYPGVLAKAPELMDKVALFLDARRAVDGHCPGLRGKALSAYAAAGIGTDHECGDPAEGAEKVAKGLYVMLRDGSAAHDIDALVRALTPENARRFLLCSDDRHVDDIVERGHMDHALNVLLGAGFPLVEALRIASLNPSERYGIPDSGAIAPGYRADFVLFDDPARFVPGATYKRGRLVAKEGLCVAPMPGPAKAPRDSVNIKWLSAEDFRIEDRGAKVRVIEAIDDSIVTGSLVVWPKVEGGYCVADPERDLAKLFVIERHRGSGTIGKGFLKGFGLKKGAIGSTISHDSHNLIVAGMDDASIFRAAKYLNKIGGGLVYVEGDTVVAELPLPIAGLMSDRDAAFVCARLADFSAAFESRGVTNPEPLMTLAFMALPVIPTLKLTNLGLVDVDQFSKVDLYVS
jgi:adenine deaminase